MLAQNICSVIDAQPEAILIQGIVPLPRQSVISTLKPEDPFAGIGSIVLNNKINNK